MALKRIFIFLTVTVTLLLIADWLVGIIFFKPDTTYRGIKEYLQKDYSSPLYLAQPFLNYINNPQSVADNGNRQINSLGIRYPTDVAMPKPDRTLRILFLGGSTTFGEVAETANAFPALLQQTIKDSLPILAPQFDKVECLNAGMGAATSAELLTHYLLKYKYMEPDVVVIHAGINDAFAIAKINNYEYQPDYHTSKRILQTSTEVTPAMRFFSHSNMACFFILHTYFERQLKTDFKTNDFFEYNNRNLWFPNGNDFMLVPRYNAFYNNVVELVRSMTGAGKPVLLVTEVVEPHKMPDELRRMLAEGIEQDRLLMMKAGEDLKVPVCVLDKKDFYEKYFIDYDGIHVNEKGELLKAEKIKPYLFKLITEIKTLR